MKTTLSGNIKLFKMFVKLIFHLVLSVLDILEEFIKIKN